MSFLQNLFGGTFAGHFAEGTDLFESEDYGNAKLCLERAVSRGKGAPSDELQTAKGMIEQCRIRLAEAKIGEADREAAEGELEAAILLLRDAREISNDPRIAEAISQRFKDYESEDTRRLVDDSEELSEEELMTIIAGTWTEAQAEEYAAMPEELHQALLASHDGDHQQAVEILKGIMSRNDLPVPPRYLYFELGREAVLTEQHPEAVEMLDAFAKAVEADDEAREAMVQACDLKAASLAALERFDEAERSLWAATRITPNDHIAFLKLGVFLRGRDKFDAAIQALDMARELMGQMQPDFAVIRELGFTYLKMKRNDEAKGCLTAVIEHLASRGEHSQFDPTAAVALASLHEETGDYMLAADLYRHLAVGYDTRNHFIYNSEAARLLKVAGAKESLVERYLTRAHELAKTEAEKARLDQIEGD